MLLEGLHIPLATPFRADGPLNLHKLSANVERYSRTPASGLIVLGPSGEPTLLDDNETREVLRGTAQAAAPEKVLIAGISRDSVRATLALADYAAKQSYDAVLVRTPTTVAPAQTREFTLYFQAIADRSSLPVVLLDSARHAFSATSMAALAAHPNIIGLIDASAGTGNVSQFLERTSAKKRDVLVTQVFAAVTGRMQKAASRANNAPVSAGLPSGTSTGVVELPIISPTRTRTRSVGFQIVSGNTAAMLDSLKSGAVGIAPAFAACAPQACYEVFAAWKDGDQPLVEEKQTRLRDAAALAEASPGSLKFTCDLNGYFGGLPRLPHLPPTSEQRTSLEAAMKGLRN